MRHYVHGPDGQKYGPADLTMLQQWAGEGRVTPETMLEPEVGGPPFAARDLPGLFPAQQVQQQSQPQPPYGPSTMGYAQYPYQDPAAGLQAKNYALATWILGAIGILCCPVVFGTSAIYTATKAKSLNHPMGGTLVAYAVICTVLGCGLGIFTVIANGMLSGLGK